MVGDGFCEWWEQYDVQIIATNHQRRYTSNLLEEKEARGKDWAKGEIFQTVSHPVIGIASMRSDVVVDASFLDVYTRSLRPSTVRFEESEPRQMNAPILRPSS